jgi:hypothetical protein
MGSILLIFTVLSLAKVSGCAFGAAARLNFYGSQNAPTSSAHAKSARVNQIPMQRQDLAPITQRRCDRNCRYSTALRRSFGGKNNKRSTSWNESGQTIIAARDRRAVAVLPAYVYEAPALSTLRFSQDRSD